MKLVPGSFRVASVRVAVTDEIPPYCLPVTLLAGSPRVAPAGPGICRVDARGWGRRGGEEALIDTLLAALDAAGFRDARIGVADVPIAADAAAWLAGLERAGSDHLPVHARIVSRRAIVVRPGATRGFLAPLPLGVLPISEDLRETLRALGILRIGDLAARERSELEMRFGTAGARAHRFSVGLDSRVFRAMRHDTLPEAALQLEAPVAALEPLLFVLRGMIERVCRDLAEIAMCAARLQFVLRLTEGGNRIETIVPARPTGREHLLYDLCRAALERMSGEDSLHAPVEGLVLRVERCAPASTRQVDLFSFDWRDPAAADAALSRLRARLGDDVAVWPAPVADHRPETRNAWAPIRLVVNDVAGASHPPVSGDGETWPDSAFRMLPDPVPVRVRSEGGHPVELEEPEGKQDLVLSEGPERFSGDWWKAPYHREYFRACTAGGEILWLFREYRRGGGDGGGGDNDTWWLHGYWD